MATCRHSDIQRFGDIRCCLSCGETVFDSHPEPSVTFSSLKSPEYQYKPLRRSLGEEIRLVLLYAGRPLGELKCDIVVVNLADRPAYEALSYTWADMTGDASLSSRIVCRGQTINITKNCEAALQRLRLESRNRYLWIDAICINQRDAAEKSYQVRLMPQIYANASQVLAYLGVEPSWVTASLRRLIDYIEDRTSTALEDSNLKETLTEFLELPYFDRVWILQEVGLSQLATFIVGAHEVRWTGAAVSKMLDLCFTLGVRAPSILRWDPARRPEEERDVLAVLSKSRNCSATDPRDKVYALMGLTHPSFSTKFPVDYSISAYEVYTNLAVYCLDEGRFDVLQHCHGETGFESILTWVLQWDIQAAFEPSPVQFSGAQKHAFAKLWMSPPCAKSDSWLRHDLPRRLIIEEFLSWLPSPDLMFGCEHIATLECYKQIATWSMVRSENGPSRAISQEDCQYLARYVVHEQSREFTYKTLKRHTEMSLMPHLHLKIRAHHLGDVSRVLGPILNARRYAFPQISWSALGNRPCQRCIHSHVSPLFDNALEQEREVFASNVEIYGAGATAFTTEFSIGFARCNVWSGLSVWAVYGTDVPFLLRERGNHYTLVRDCYLHRAGRPFPCKHCGADVDPWPMETHIVIFGDKIASHQL